MEKDDTLFLIGMLMSIPPWGWILQFAGVEAQVCGLIVQIIGIIALLKHFVK